jgi:branched-chain amino acid transport system ATP-binding protein
VLDQIGLHVARGEKTVAVPGPTGAGKSTLMKCLRGLIRPVSGSIGFGAAALARLPAHRLARAGLILVPEGRQVFARLTVAEKPRSRCDPAQRLRRKRDLFHAGSISEAACPPAYGRRSVVGRRAANACRCPRPSGANEILLLDEPPLGLAPAVATELFGQFRKLREEGVILLIVDQMADHVLAGADRAHVLGGGRVVAQGVAAEMRDKML